MFWLKKTPKKCDDVERISDETSRICVERRVLRVGMRLLIDAENYESMDRVLELADSIMEEEQLE